MSSRRRALVPPGSSSQQRRARRGSGPAAWRWRSRPGCGAGPALTVAPSGPPAAARGRTAPRGRGGGWRSGCRRRPVPGRAGAATGRSRAAGLRCGRRCSRIGAGLAFGRAAAGGVRGMIRTGIIGLGRARASSRRNAQRRAPAGRSDRSAPRRAPRPRWPSRSIVPAGRPAPSRIHGSRGRSRTRLVVSGRALSGGRMFADARARLDGWRMRRRACAAVDVAT